MYFLTYGIEFVLFLAVLENSVLPMGCDSFFSLSIDLSFSVYIQPHASPRSDIAGSGWQIRW